MRFKTAKNDDAIPTINLVPMLDVITVILTFFVLVSMTLTTDPSGVDVSLPGQSSEEKAKESSTDEPPPILEVKVEAQGKILVDGKDLEKERLLQTVPGYLENNPESTIVVLPAPDAPYEQVLQLLTQLREIASDRVSLAVGSSSEAEASESEETTEVKEESEVEEDVEESPKNAEKSGGKSLD